MELTEQPGDRAHRLLLSHLPPDERARFDPPNVPTLMDAGGLIGWRLPDGTRYVLAADGRSVTRTRYLPESDGEELVLFIDARVATAVVVGEGT